MTEENNPVIMETSIVKTETIPVPVVPPANVNQANACRMKGYSHPGSYIDLPGGQKIHMQFDVSPLQIRNGLTSTELFAGLRDHFMTYQSRVAVEYQEGDEDITYPDGSDGEAPLIFDEEEGKLSVFKPNLYSEETAEMVRLLHRCWLLSQSRQLDREKRGVRFQDKA